MWATGDPAEHQRAYSGWHRGDATQLAVAGVTAGQSWTLLWRQHHQRTVGVDRRTLRSWVCMPCSLHCWDITLSLLTAYMTAINLQQSL